MKEEHYAAFYQVATPWLELYDAQLNVDSKPLQTRPLACAIMFVEGAVLEVEGGTKVEYFKQEWFVHMVKAVRRWYVEKYGAESMAHSDRHLSGIALFHGMPRGLSIPETVHEVETVGETIWVYFPGGIHKSEKVVNFFAVKPNLASLGEKEVQALDEQVSNVVRWTRSTKKSLQAISDLPLDREQLPAGIMGHLEKAVLDILTLDKGRAAVACWDLHLAVEKALKILLAQNGLPHHGHDLVALASAAESAGHLKTPNGLRKLPAWRVANQLRYAEIEISVQEVVEHYFAALEVVFEVTSQLRHEISMGDDAGLLIRRAPWASD